jgi:xylulokinase
MHEKAVIVGIDVGTSGVKVLAIDTTGEVRGTAYREYPCIYPRPGWVEQDVGILWTKLCEASREAIRKNNLNPSEIKSIGISSQRGTFIPVDDRIRPLMNSIVWSDSRAITEMQLIRNTLGAERFHQVSGVPLSGLWAYTKIKWLIDHEPEIFSRTCKILNGQEYFLHKLGAEELSTDPASTTLNGMLDIQHLNWSEELCSLIGLSMDKLPRMGTPARMAGRISRQAAEQSGFLEGTPIAFGAGDQQCAAIGSGVVKEGMAEITIGTGMVVVAHIESRKNDPERTVLVGGSGIPGKYDMEGVQLSAGAALKWWRDVYAQQEREAAERLGLDVYDLITLEAAKSPVGSKGALFFPFFQGQSTPYYNDLARGGGLGISLNHDRNDMARSVLEGISFETKMIIKAMENVLGRGFDVIRLSGGGAKSSFWNQMQADIYARPIEKLVIPDCAVLGAAILGAAGCGVFSSVHEGVEALVRTFGTIDPIESNSVIYAEEAQIYENGYLAISRSGVYEQLSSFQSRHWI